MGWSRHCGTAACVFVPSCEFPQCTSIYELWRLGYGGLEKFLEHQMVVIRSSCSSVVTTKTEPEEWPTSVLQWGINGNFTVPCLTVYHPGFPFAYRSCEHSWWYISRSRLCTSPPCYAPNERKHDLVVSRKSSFPQALSV